MIINNTEIPTALVNASLSGSLVVFAGAGVSMQKPMELPSFDKLVEQVKNVADPANRLRGRRFSRGAGDAVIYKESPEQYLGFLESEGKDVRTSCARLVASGGQTSELHVNLLRLFPSDLPCRIVTTNFDDCFENALKNVHRKCAVFNSPALPLGSDMEGLVHLHGIIDNPKSMVLTARDYGRAYVSNGWSSRFLVDLFKTYTVVFVGYSCGDSLVDYLTRSISNEITGSTFVLCRETDNTDDWRMRGVTPVTFDDFDDLPCLVGKWADYIEQSVTNRVCKLRDLGVEENLTPEQADYLMHTLQWHDEDDRALFTREFCAQSTTFDHLALFHERGLTGFLVNNEMIGADFILLRWAVTQFSVHYCGDLQRLCCNMKESLSVHFYYELTRHFTGIDAPASAIGPWIAWLESAPYQYHIQCMHNLAYIASRTDSPDIALAILMLLSKVNLAFSEKPFLGSRGEAIIPVKDSYYEKQLMGCLKKHMDAIGDKVFNHCVSQIELAYSIQTGCWTNEKTFDSISFSRSSVGPHDQDSHADGAGSILLNLARESVCPKNAGVAAEKCLQSRCTLLIRLGLWITEQYNCDGECLELIEKNEYLGNTYLHHEVFQLVKSSFEVASPAQRKRFTDYLQVFYGEHDDSGYACFNMCNWILDTVEDDVLQKMRKDVLLRHPNYMAREHPDFTHYLTSGVVDNTSECRIEECDFTIESMLNRLEQLKATHSFVTEYDMVSVPASDYPELAVAMVKSLLCKVRSPEESALCNMLISSIEWSLPVIDHEDLLRIVTMALSDQETCIAAVSALAFHTYTSPNKILWKREELEQLLLAISPNIALLLEAESAIVPSDDPDWGLVGINHPAGKYLELVTMLEKAALRDGEINEIALTLLKDLDILALPESPTVKALLACFFEHFNTWTAADSSYTELAAKLLAEESWVQSPAWQGIARLPRLSKEAWDITENHWKELFRGRIVISENLYNSLVRLYVWLAIVRADKTDRTRMLVICGSASDTSLQTACLQIDNWLETLDEAERADAWDGWLSESFEQLARSSEDCRKTIARFYSRWIRAFPDIRKRIAEGIVRDCQELDERDLFVHEGTLTDTASDPNLAVNTKAEVLVFLLEHQRVFRYEEDARTAASYINLHDLSDDLATRLRDAYTRCGMHDVAMTLGSSEDA